VPHNQRVPPDAVNRRQRGESVACSAPSIAASGRGASTAPVNFNSFYECAVVTGSMRQDTIARIEIDASGRLHVSPSAEKFPHIYREAMEVHWDAQQSSLYSPPPREWSFPRWFRQIKAAARRQGCELRLVDGTEWKNVGENVRRALERRTDGEEARDDETP